jgi:acyl-CoA thioester hydrolase
MFSTTFRVRYAEIDGQKVVFNSRYLEYADVAMSEYWDWTGIEALGAIWSETEFHIRHASVDYRRPFVWRDRIEARVRLVKIGGSSLTMAIDLYHATTGELHTVIEMVSVNVHLPSGKAVRIADEMRVFLERLAA